MEQSMEYYQPNSKMIVSKLHKNGKHHSDIHFTTKSNVTSFIDLQKHLSEEPTHWDPLADPPESHWDPPLDPLGPTAGPTGDPLGPTAGPTGDPLGPTETHWGPTATHWNTTSQTVR